MSCCQLLGHVLLPTIEGRVEWFEKLLVTQYGCIRIIELDVHQVQSQGCDASRNEKYGPNWL